MEPITIGSKGTASVQVDETNLAVAVGSGSLPVFATPMMAALMEEAACNAVAPFLSEGETTVGTGDLLSRYRRGRRRRDRFRRAQAVSGRCGTFPEQGTETRTVRMAEHMCCVCR